MVNYCLNIIHNFIQKTFPCKTCKIYLMRVLEYVCGIIACLLSNKAYMQTLDLCAMGMLFFITALLQPSLVSSLAVYTCIHTYIKALNI